jgi:hypothetical protein
MIARIILILILGAAFCALHRFSYDAGHFDGHVEGFSKGLDDGYRLAGGHRS